MSLESEVADLTTAANALTAEVTNKVTEIDQAVQDAINTNLPVLSFYYVDPATGNDANAGDTGNPLLTVDEALTRTGPGEISNIYLLGDCTISKVTDITNRTIAIQGYALNPNANTTRKLDVLDVATNNAGSIAGFRAYSGFTYLCFSYIDVELPVMGVGASAEYLIYMTGRMAFKQYAGSVTGAAGFDTNIFKRDTHASLDWYTTSTYGAEVDGHYVKSIAAATDPDTLEWLSTNLTSL